MTQEQKARAYDEALEKARKLYNDAKANEYKSDMEDYEFIFPELAESEDERIRKWIIGLLGSLRTKDRCTECLQKLDEAIAYLEKQKEQKPEWSEEDEERLKAICTYLQDYPRLAKINDVKRFNEYCDWLKSLPLNLKKKNEDVAKLCSNEWSEEDETALGDLMWCIEQARKSAKDENDMGNIWFAENWVKNRLKSLRPQSKQEWSEEDERMRNALWNLLKIQYAQDYSMTGVGIEAGKFRDWLEALGPSWKPSEDEERLINTSISFLKDFADKGYENAVECIDWLKSKLNGNSGK